MDELDRGINYLEYKYQVACAAEKNLKWFGRWFFGTVLFLIIGLVILGFLLK